MSAAPVTVETHRALLTSILTYLSSLKQSPLSSSLLPNPDSLDAALDCLTEATGLSLSTTSSLPPLPTLFLAGQQAPSSSSSSSAASSSVPSDSDVHFQQFLALLTEKGFFTGLTPGTAAYNERLNAARSKYAEKYPSGGGAAAAGAPKVVTEADRATAEKLKNEGNSFLTAGKNSQAVDKYSAAIALNPTSAIYYANRAAAHINLSQYSKAEADCRSSVLLDPSYGKAHYRLGQALLQQQRPTEAIAAFQKALQFTDANMREAVEEQLEAAKAAEGRMHGVGNVDDGADGDGGEMPDLSSIMKNPMFAQLAAQLGAAGGGGEGGAGGLDFNALLNNPQIMQMASQMFGGASTGAAPAGPRSSPTPSTSSTASPPPPPSSSSDAISSFLNSPAASQFASDPVLAPVIEDVRKNGQSALYRHINNPAVMAKLTQIAGPMLAQMKR